MKLTKQDQMLCFHTKVLKAFSDLNFDKLLYPSNIEGRETYITTGSGQDKKHIEGYELVKKHKGEKVPTTYFVRTADIKNLPLLIESCRKIHCRNKVYNLLNHAESVKIEPEQILNWGQIIDGFGIPNHTNQLHYKLYKIKRLYARTTDQFYGRYITESGFGKDKVSESYRLLINESCVISDPTVANLFYRAIHNRDITINELPDDTNKKEFNKLCNLFMRIGDKTNVLDNRARSVQGTTDTAHIDKLSVCFTHNVPEYYLNKGKRCFAQIYPYNVLNRYYPNLYTGFMEANFPDTMNYTELAEKYSDYLKAMIKSLLWYQDNWSKLKNNYPDVSLDQFLFSKKEARYREHFVDFARAVSHYAKDSTEYLTLLEIDYQSHKDYLDMLDTIQGNEKYTVIEEEVK